MGKGQASEAAVAERSADGERELKQRKLVGYQNFVRNNPMSDKFEVHRFHHIEVWCGDATNAARRCALSTVSFRFCAFRVHD
jgi:4-hydroxyphenylpyruvate dioxygenase